MLLPSGTKVCSHRNTASLSKISLASTMLFMMKGHFCELNVPNKLASPEPPRSRHDTILPDNPGKHRSQTPIRSKYINTIINSNHSHSSDLSPFQTVSFTLPVLFPKL